MGLIPVGRPYEVRSSILLAESVGPFIVPCWNETTGYEAKGYCGEPFRHYRVHLSPGQLGLWEIGAVPRSRYCPPARGVTLDLHAQVTPPRA